MTALEQYTSRAEEVLAYWVEHSRQSAEDGLNKGIISDASLIDYLKKLLA